MIQCPCCGEKLRVAMKGRRAVLTPASKGSGLRFQTNMVFYKGKGIRLTPTEYRTLSILDDSFGHMVSRERLVEGIYGLLLYDAEGPDYPSATTRVYVTHLRRKLLDTPFNIRCVWGVGYILERFDGPWKLTESEKIKYRKEAA